MTVTCKYCAIPFDKSAWQTKRSVNHFCTRSCFAAYNNKHRASRLKKICKSCDNKILSRFTYCPDCRYDREKQHFFDESQTLSYYASKSNDMNRYRGVRLLARKKTRSWPQVCKRCKYDLHVETCHVKSLSCFPKETLVSVVNVDDNLVILCRNCHWEFDHHFIKLGPAGFEPAT